MDRFMSLLATRKGDLHVLNLVCYQSQLSRFHKSLLPVMQSVRALELEFCFNDQTESEDTDSYSGIIAALKVNRRLERLNLQFVRESLAIPLLEWLEQSVPPTLTDVTLDLQFVSQSTFLYIVKALARLPLTRLSLRDWRDPLLCVYDVAHHAECCAEIAGLLYGVPSLQNLQFNASCFDHLQKQYEAGPLSKELTDSRRTKARGDAMVRKAVFDHASVEHTNLVPDTNPIFETRRLRRHRIAGHWGQVCVVLTFARNHARALHGSVLPFLAVITALAGLVLPRTAWTANLTRTIYFANSRFAQAGTCGKRKRSLAAS